MTDWRTCRWSAPIFRAMVAGKRCEESPPAVLETSLHFIFGTIGVELDLPRPLSIVAAGSETSSGRDIRGLSRIPVLRRRVVEKARALPAGQILIAGPADGPNWTSGEIRKPRRDDHRVQSGDMDITGMKKWQEIGDTVEQPALRALVRAVWDDDTWSGPNIPTSDLIWTSPRFSIDHPQDSGALRLLTVRYADWQSVSVDYEIPAAAESFPTRTSPF